MDKIEKIRQEIAQLKGVKLYTFSDTLSEEPDKSLEEEMDKFFETMPVLEHENIFEDTFKNIARHFAEWQKEQMLKEAVEGVVYRYESYQRIATAIVVDINRELLGNKVRIIVLPKEEEK